jgi:hypothetical protein
VLSNTGRNNNPIECPSGNAIRILTCAEFRDAAKGDTSVEGALRRFYPVALQHYLVALVQSAGAGWGMFGESSAGLKQKMIPPIDIPDVTVYELDQLLSVTPSDRSLFTPALVFNHQLKLPKSSDAFFLTTTDIESYVFRIERNNYYRLDLVVVPLQMSRKGLIPENYTMGFPDTSPITTYSYEIRLDLTVQRTNDASFVSSDYVEWGFALFNNIKLRLEN